MVALDKLNELVLGCNKQRWDMSHVPHLYKKEHLEF